MGAYRRWDGAKEDALVSQRRLTFGRKMLGVHSPVEMILRLVEDSQTGD